ncbi:hypothetical protein [Roseimicrobium sp. ORNL1]|uniref:hypothetical protein n=1 Tax=Roseimicrobium sp. ORNL1 TaxID=2711231 RepID=UPI0013E1527F|nr:hypothetical protein [Roseimicrobium sp. ORNL1]QIF04418.1 hypothetical protein G5S37_23795 [Roseimicrobium sp. ORNL1]
MTALPESESGNFDHQTLDVRELLALQSVENVATLESIQRGIDDMSEERIVSAAAVHEKLRMQ